VTRRRLLGTILTVGLCASSVWATSAGAALGPAPFPAGDCPPQVGNDTNCQYGISVTAVDVSGVATPAGTTIYQDGDQPSYDGVEDALILVQNDSSSTLVHLPLGASGTGDDLFGFDSDGLCNPPGFPNAPAIGPNCTWPNPTTYEGPGTLFTVADSDSGTVDFSPALAPGQHTYFSLELLAGYQPTPGGVNNFITTTQSAPGQQPAQHVAVQPGTNVTDTAVINGPHGAPSPPAVNGGDGTGAGTVVYTLFNNAGCQGTPVYTSGAKAVSGGVAAPSDPVGAALPEGRYWWQVTYSGDGGPSTHNSPSVANCGLEILQIGGTRVVTKLSASQVSDGTPVSDTATITSKLNPLPLGALPDTITFNVFSDANCTQAIAGDAQTITLNGTSASSNAIVLPPGTYYWRADFSGDAKNAPGSSQCGSEVVTVLPPPCHCAKIQVYANHFHIFGAGSTKIEFNFHSAITCTFGSGGCSGTVQVFPPVPANFIDSSRARNPSGRGEGGGAPAGFKTPLPSVGSIGFTCAGPCGGTTVQRPVILQYIALIRHKNKRGKIVRTTSNPNFLPKGRANKSFKITVLENCNGVISTMVLTIHFDKHGQVDYKKSDLNGDGRRDRKQLTDLTGF
jgi:hypothetical protein